MLKATRRNNCSSASLTSSFKAALGVLAGVCRASLSVGLQLRSITELPETAQICNYGVLVHIRWTRMIKKSEPKQGQSMTVYSNHLFFNLRLLQHA